MKHVKTYIKNYPRPAFVRNNFKLLNGDWNFKFDDQDVGIKEQWYKKTIKDLKIVVPLAYQTEKSGVYDETYHEVVWYQRSFDLNKAALETETIIHFDGIDYQMQFWINDYYVGNAQGAYSRHSFNITNYLKEKNNVITVRIFDDFNTANPRGKQRWQTFNYACWYVETSGIWKSVWLEHVHKNHLNYVSIKPDIKNLSVNLTYEFLKLDNNLEIETIVSYDDEIIYQGRSNVLRNNMMQTIDVRARKDQFKMFGWSNENPNLYDIYFNVYLNGKLIDQVGSYFAMREWKAVNGELFLNYDKKYLKMVLDQSYDETMGISHLDDQTIEKDVKLIKDLGFNGVRKHQIIADERFYYFCDIYGLYSWLEMPSSYEFNLEMTTKVTNEWLRIVKQYQNYPSIMTYLIFNESWGVHHIKYHKAQQELSVALYHLTKAVDDTRFVIANDGWEHTKTDLLTLHNYTQDYKELVEGYSNLKEKLYKNELPYSQFRSTFAEGFKYEGQPIIMSEYAGIAFSDDEGWGYGDTVSDEQSFIQRYKELTKAIKENRDFVGYCATQLTDVQQETNGFLKMNRTPKANIDEIKKINNG